MTILLWVEPTELVFDHFALPTKWRLGNAFGAWELRKRTDAQQETLSR
jgi:hypothetical protein